MSRISEFSNFLFRFPERTAACFLAVVLVSYLTPAARAAIFDFDVPNGNYNVATNWVDETSANGVPGAGDEAHVRNGGTVTLNTNQSASTLRLGYSNEIEDPNQIYIEDPNNPGTFIPDPDNLLPPIDLGGAGTMEWTAGILSTNDFRVGQNHRGIVNQSGGEITFDYGGNFIIGNGDNTDSEYNMSGGTIRIGTQIPNNDGITVRKGSFNMSGGTVEDATPIFVNNWGQRSFRIASTGNAVASATFSGDAHVEVRGGVRVGDSGGAVGTLTIKENAYFQSGDGDFSIGRNGTATGIMNMEGGTLIVGVAPDHESQLKIGHNGYGELHISGGTITVTDDLNLGEKPEAIGSFINMTGGTLVTPKVVIREEALPIGIDPGGTYIRIDGPLASFTENDDGTVIGQEGVALFEVLQGKASLTEVELGDSAFSQGTLRVAGGELTIHDDVHKSDTGANSQVILQGGKLETTKAGSMVWQLDLINEGTELTLLAGARQLVNLGDVNHPADFAMDSGIWNVDLRSNLTDSGGDLINILNGSGALNGGTINITEIESYLPSPGDTIRIVSRASGNLSLNAGSITLVGDPNWSIGLFDPQDGSMEIRLSYVPEPSSAALIGLGLLVSMVGLRRKSQS